MHEDTFADDGNGKEENMPGAGDENTCGQGENMVNADDENLYGGAGAGNDNYEEEGMQDADAMGEHYPTSSEVQALITVLLM